SEGTRDADLFRFSEQSLAAGEDEQYALANHPRDSSAYAGRRRIPRRPFRLNAGRGSTATHREYEVGQAVLSRNGNAAQPASRGGSCLRSDQATADESAKDS